MRNVRAWWRSADEIILVFPRDYESVPNDIQVSGAENYKAMRSPIEELARYCNYYIDGDIAHFFLEVENKNTDIFLCGDFNNWEKAINNPEWQMQIAPDGHSYTLSVSTEKLGLQNTGYRLFKFATSNGHWFEPNFNAPNFLRDEYGNGNLKIDSSLTGKNILLLKFDNACNPCGETRVKIPQFNVDIGVESTALLRAIYSDVKLGAYLKNGKTEFAIFAPRAEKAWVEYWKEDGQNKYITEAENIDGSIWVARALTDIEGYFYVWRISGDNSLFCTMFEPEKTIADPYANAFVSSGGACVVKYLDSIPSFADNFIPPKWHDLSIVEVHIRDLLAKARVNLSDGERLGFAGLTKWLKSDDCYLRKLGVNCVELQPIQEFTAEKKTDYEWGYMPVGWFAPSSSYASDSAKATQNKEYAELVEAFHSAGFAVIIDVVYNHYGEPNYLARADAGYYFETSSDDSLLNFSGCGNDIRTASPMALRMIIDSLIVMIEKYGVDGFRFDLAELLGVKALREIETAIKRIKPSAILIAEPWSFRGHIADKLKSTGFASWNDGFRESMLQYALSNGSVESFKYFMTGSSGGYASFPAQTVNYLESHDDKCLLDRISVNGISPSFDELRRYKLAYALLFLSIGIPMSAEGFDLVRTKGGLNNTYKNGVANALDYSRAEKYAGVCEWLRAISKFRCSANARALRLDSTPNDNYFSFYYSESNAVGILFNADRSVDAPKVFAVFNPLDKTIEVPIPDDFNSYTQIADIDRFNENGIAEPYLLQTQSGTLAMPAISVGVWIS